MFMIKLSRDRGPCSGRSQTANDDKDEFEKAYLPDLNQSLEQS